MVLLEATNIKRAKRVAEYQLVINCGDKSGADSKNRPEFWQWRKSGYLSPSHPPSLNRFVVAPYKAGEIY